MKSINFIAVLICSTLLCAWNGNAETITLSAGNDVATVLNEATGPDVTLVFPAGSTFDTSAAQIVIPDAFTSVIFLGEAGEEMPLLKNKGFRPGSATQRISFTNLKCAGSNENVNSGDYFINEQTAARSMTKIALENCDISTYRSIVRFVNVANIVDTVRIKNCIIHNTGGYNVLQLDANNLVKKVLIENNTFYDLTNGFITTIRKPEKVEVKNCTFYNAVKNGGYIYDYGNLTGSNTDSIAGNEPFINCIFSKVYGGGTAKAARNSKILYYPTCYQLNDYEASAAMNIMTYDASGSDVFTDPGNANFKIKDANFPGKNSTGDPRWYYDNTPNATPTVKGEAKNILSHQYFDLTGKQITKQNVKGLYIEKIIYEDGEVFTHKVLKAE